MQGITVLLGCITIGLIFVVEHLGTIFEITHSLMGAIAGAHLGLFLAGMLLPWIGKTGAISGAYSSLVIMTWIVCGQQWHIFKKRIHYPSLPTSTDACPYPFNETLLMQQKSLNATFSAPPLAPEDQPMILFRIAILYLMLLGAIIVIVVGGVTSYFVGETDMLKVNPDHLSPVVRRFVCCKFIRFNLDKIFG